MKIKICSAGNCYYKKPEIEGIEFERCGCLGYCGFGPIGIIDSKIIPINTSLLKQLKENPNVIQNVESLNFDKDNKILMRNNDTIDPENIDTYVSVGGFKGLLKALEMDPDSIIEEIERSGLRGRGGAGFPTHKKMQMVKTEDQTPKYVVANLEEGEVASFNNTILAESNPFSIIEGMIIAAYAVGASKGFIFVNHKAKIALKRLQKAIDQAKQKRYLGQIKEGFSFDIEIRRSPSAYIAGEETAMLEVIEGKKAFPRNKPPFPVSKGLFKKPTLINNVETLAAIPYIILYGSDFYRSFGTEGSYGTKMISLTGNVNNPCVNEIPFNTKIKDIIEKIGRGYRSKNKGFLIGGPSGGILAQEVEELEYNYDTISKTGGMVGSGGIYAIEESISIPELCWYLMKFFADESCGQCIPCRVGTKKLTEILDNFLKGRELPYNLDEISDFIMNVSLCGLGQAAPIPLLTAIKYFPEEFKQKISV
ncbi:MAG: NADH-ubiquinone oxidoreductase-F iron-sulfur binding region domain-containing protein [Candidatus Calescibacterium sp.]|nr:NADH-quinone oxidoreductase subunit F [Candidatus Calescibacterium sp.]MCX7972238.1 NADH-quinone oxidoreductase subunit F [bacterium]MDW8195161.1 NADH-ubiquinone oxidoreductase-F iron-sulfur binding region domain-containing protein [Candidatus Calescibacterium sp.]